MDSGTAYGRPTPSYDATLVEVGPGTPGGDLLRRYWHPVAVAADEEPPGPPAPRRQAFSPRHRGDDAEPAHRRQSVRDVSRARFNGKSWAELTEEEHQRTPHDYAAQEGQGMITLHSEERSPRAIAAS
jgi:hypothetical protein